MVREAKLKTLLRKASKRTLEDTWRQHLPHVAAATIEGIFETARALAEWYFRSARATAWRRARLEDGSLAARPYRRSSVAAPVRLALGRRGCHCLTKWS
jgi:hypothetical protein